MAISLVVEFEGTADQYDQVDAKLDLKGNPPEGLIVHTAADRGGTVRVIDIWESEQAFEKFGEERLGPAIGEVMGADAPRVEPEITELHNLFKA